MAGLDQRATRGVRVGHGLGALPNFRLSSNSFASSGLIKSTLAMRGPCDTNAEFSFGGGVTFPAGVTVGAGVVDVGFAGTIGAL